jgi:transposase InsO family protein
MIWRQAIEATPWRHRPRHLLRDRDAAYGRDFRQRVRRIGIDGIETPIHAPKANAIIGRGIGTLRRECLDHLIVLNEQHLVSCWPSASAITTAPSRSDPVAAGAERTAPRLRTCLSAAEVLPSDNAPAAR